MIALQFPTAWDDLSPRQFKHIASALFMSLPSVVLDLSIFTALYGIRWWQMLRYYRLKKIIRNYSIDDLKTHYMFLYEQSNRLDFIPSIKRKGAMYYPPKRFMYNLTIAEYAVLDSFYMQIKAHLSNKVPIQNQRVALQNMCSIIYQKNNPDVRDIFKKEQLGTLALAWDSCPLDFMITVFITYQGCRTALEKRYTRVFTGGKKSKGKQYGFGKLILNMAGNKFGTHKETANTLLHTFMEQLNEDLTPEKLK